jgi:lipoprotein signal peptidase
MESGSGTPPWPVYAGVLGAAVVVDLATKALAHDGPYDGFPIEPVRNEELALGVASFDVGFVPLLALAALAGFVLLYGFRLSRESRTSAVMYCLLLGGVLGNAIDRLVTGSVHDWLDLGVAIANIADVFIVVGLAWFATAAWRSVA